jgi:hypothetical protein
MSLNVSVLAVLHTALPVFGGQLSLVDMFTGIAGVVRGLIETFPKIRAGVRSVLEVDLQPEDIRVPLDVQRTEMRSLQ